MHLGCFIEVVKLWRCKRTSDLLIRYSIIDFTNTPEEIIFMPNMAGPGDITPLHLTATPFSYDIGVALTSHPHEVWIPHPTNLEICINKDLLLHASVMAASFL